MMKKVIKKLLAALLAVAMVCAMAFVEADGSTLAPQAHHGLAGASASDAGASFFSVSLLISTSESTVLVS